MKTKLKKEVPLQPVVDWPPECEAALHVLPVRGGVAEGKGSFIKDEEELMEDDPVTLCAADLNLLQEEDPLHFDPSDSITHCADHAQNVTKDTQREQVHQSQLQLVQSYQTPSPSSAVGSLDKLEESRNGCIEESVESACHNFHETNCKSSLTEQNISMTAINQMSFSCRVCGKGFAQKKSLSRHMTVHNSFHAFECELCDKTFTSKCALNRHLLVHQNIRPFECQVCNKSFKRKEHLDGHMAIHSNVRAYMCEVCNKSFTQHGHLYRHMLLHKNIRSFKCESCNKCFTDKGDLKKHSMTHSSVREFECEVCHRTFTLRKYLNAHVLIHYNVHPFHCTLCNRTFTQMSALSSHMLLHSNVRQFKCEFCQKLFSRQTHLTWHYVTHRVLENSSAP